MSKNARKKPASTDSRNYRFINVSLTVEDKKWLASDQAESTFPLDTMFDLVSSGYKISFNEDTKNACYVCSLTDQREDSPHYRTILPGRGSTPFNAWLAVAYRHFILGREEWSSFQVPDQDNSDDFG